MFVKIILSIFIDTISHNVWKLLYSTYYQVLKFDPSLCHFVFLHKTTKQTNTHNNNSLLVI